MATNYFDFLEQNSSDNPASSTPGNNNGGMVNLTTRADADCQVVCDGDFLFLLNANQIAKEKAPAGQHILEFVSIDHPEISVEKIVDFPEPGKNYLVVVKEFRELFANAAKKTAEVKSNPAEKKRPVVKTAKNSKEADNIVTIDFVAKNKDKGKYTGLVKKGKPEGKGKVVFESGNAYEGEFYNGWRHGKGVLMFANGEKYEGDFADDKLTGRAKYTYENGDTFEGEFLDGEEQNKPNVYVWANGDRLECEGWDNGSDGKGTYYFKDGRKLESIWDQGINIKNINYDGYWKQSVIGGRAILEVLSKSIKNRIIRAAEINASAQFVLGLAYATGIGVPKDRFKAAQWYKRAAENGHAMAQGYYAFDLSWGDYIGKNYSEALSWCKKGAEQGNCYAQRILGDLYYFNENHIWRCNSPTEMATALFWYRKAADQGDPLAQFKVGKCYYDGMGTTRSRTDAVKWIQMSAEHNCVDAQVWLAKDYEFGVEDIKNARIWYQKAAEQGDEYAKSALQRLGIK